MRKGSYHKPRRPAPRNRRRTPRTPNKTSGYRRWGTPRRSGRNA